MGKNAKTFGVWAYSTVGVLGMGILLIAVNIVVRTGAGRVDFSERQINSLSAGTKAILKQMPTPVTIRFYYTRDSALMPVFLKTYATRVEDLLREYRYSGGGKVKLDILDPAPDSDAEDSANLDGVTGQPLSNGEAVYLGLAVSCLKQTVVLPFLSPDREALLEYDITRAIYRAQTTEKPAIGLLSSLPVFGTPPMFMQMGGQPQEPWMFVTELKRDFDVQTIAPNTDTIPPSLKMLIVVHPKQLSDKTLFALDQYLLGGGKLLAFVDPMSVVDARSNPAGGMQPTPPGASTLGKLLDAWGVQFDTEKVVADLLTMTQIRGQDGNPERQPAWLSLTPDDMDKSDPTTAQLDGVLMVLAGSFNVKPAAALRKTTLMSSSEDSQGVEKFLAQMGGEAMLKDFKADHARKDLAVRLTGTFKSAFPAGKPQDEAKPDDPEAKKDAKAETQPAEPARKQSAKPGAVVLVGDVDMLYDAFCVRTQSVFGQKVVMPLNDNLSFVQNLVDYLSGDENLISLRSRGVSSRPFVVVARMQAEAEKQYQDKIREIEEELSNAQRKLMDLEREKSKDQRTILSAAQKQEIAEFQKKVAAKKQELKSVRRQLRHDIDVLETQVKWANIALMPILVGITGIAAAIIRKRRAKAG